MIYASLNIPVKIFHFCSCVLDTDSFHWLYSLVYNEACRVFTSCVMNSPNTYRPWYTYVNVWHNWIDNMKMNRNVGSSYRVISICFGGIFFVFLKSKKLLYERFLMSSEFFFFDLTRSSFLCFIDQLTVLEYFRNVTL